MIVNNIRTEGEHYATTLLAQKMHNRKHDVFYLSVEDLSYTAGGLTGGKAVKAGARTFRSTGSYLENLKESISEREHVTSKDIDIFMLRNDPAEEDKTRAWARVSPISFGQLAVTEGSIVLNDPAGLSNGLSKTYILQFPKEIQAKTLISRDRNEIVDFFKSSGKNIILKPLFGSGGRSVFQVNENNFNNLNQMIEAISQEGYIVAQEFVPESEQGDTRIFMINGRILQHKGKYAAIRRKNANGDIRSNLHAGGKAKLAVITEDMLKIAEMVRPNLVRDGMFFVGLDIIGSKLIEVNVYSPGGLFSASHLNEVDFTEPFIDSLEHKVYLKNLYLGKITNRDIATL